MGSADSVIRKLGIFDELNQCGVKIVEFEKSVSWKHFTKLQSLERCFNNLELAGELIEYDQTINVPKLKSHGQMGITLATKNLFGCVVGHAKGRWHFVAGRDLHAFAWILVEIALTVNVSLHTITASALIAGNAKRTVLFRPLVSGNRSGSKRLIASNAAVARNFVRWEP